MTTEFNPGGAANLNDAVKKRYEANSNTNAYTDAEKSKLAGVAASANNYSHPNHSGDVTSVGDGATTIANNAVTTAKLADIATSSVIGRVSASTGDPEVLTTTQLTTLIDNFTSSLKGSVPPSGGGTSNYLRADGTWATPPGGGGGGGGDMYIATYDPTGKSADAFSMDNMVEGTATKIMTNVERTKLSGIATSANNYTHPNHTGDVTSTGDGATTIANNAVTYAKMQNATAGYTIMAKAASGSGAYAELAAGTDGVLRRSGSGNLAFGTIDSTNISDAAITMAKLANVATATVVGRVAASTGVPKALSTAELTTLVDTFTTSLKGAVPAATGGNTTTQFLRKDGTWAVPAGGATLSAITEDILPATNNTYDLGSDTYRWAEGHFSSTLKLGGYNVITENATALTQKATPVDADKIPIFDSADSDNTKYATRGSIVAGYTPTSRTLTAGTGIATIGDLSANRTIALSAGSITSLGLADSSVQPARTITAGTGLTGGGTLAADRTISLSSGSIASLALADASAPKLVTINAQTASYTLVSGDAGCLVTMNNASANQLTIPANATVAYSVGTVIVIQQIGAGVTTVKGATGVTLNGVSAGGGALTQWGSCSIIKTATNTWLAMGGIGTVA